MNITDMIIQIIVSFFGTLGFGILFNIKGKKLFFAALGGMLAWSAFLALGLLISGEVLRYFIVSLLSTIYAEILARILKTPATTFCIITLIPLIPGSALYYTTTFALSGNSDMFLEKLIYTLELSAALSLGIMVITALFRLIKIGKKNQVS